MDDGLCYECCDECLQMDLVDHECIEEAYGCSADDRNDHSCRERHSL